MTFATDLALLPFAPAKPEATGFLPPIARALGHLLFVLEHVAAERTPALPDDELLGELTHARDHWNVLDANGTLSAATLQTSNHVAAALTSAVDEFNGWDHDTRIRNLRDLAHRLVAFTVVLDRELLGLRNSDAGHAL